MWVRRRTGRRSAVKCPRCNSPRLDVETYAAGEAVGCKACGWVGPPSECSEGEPAHPDDKLFTDIKPPGIFYRTSLTLHAAYSGPRENATSHVAVRMPQDGSFNILALGPAIQMAMANFAKQHPDGFEKAIEELVEGAMQCAGHSTSRDASEVDDENT